MSIETGMLVIAICFSVMTIGALAYFWADYELSKSHKAFVRRKIRARQHDVSRAEKEIKGAIWEACEFTVNNIKRELW